MTEPEQQNTLDDETVVYITFVDNLLVVDYKSGKTISLELETPEEVELIRTVISDVNLWANFLQSMSQAVKEKQ